MHPISVRHHPLDDGPGPAGACGDKIGGQAPRNEPAPAGVPAAQIVRAAVKSESVDVHAHSHELTKEIDGLFTGSARPPARVADGGALRARKIR